MYAGTSAGVCDTFKHLVAMYNIFLPFLNKGTPVNVPSPGS
jgi:hypothetical protein